MSQPYKLLFGCDKMKKTIIALSLVLALAFSFSGCFGKKEKVKEYNSAADFAEFNISLDAPENSQNKKYGVIESSHKGETLTIAQVTYDYEGINCTLRSANIGEYNVSGYAESKAESEEVYDLNVEGYDSQIRVMKVGEEYIALWFLGEHSYSLSAKTSDDMTFTSCAIDAANANVPSNAAVTN